MDVQHPRTLTAKDGLAQIYLELDMIDNAIQLFEETLSQRKDILGSNTPEHFKLKMD